VDVALLSCSDGTLRAIVARRRRAPFVGDLALPGVFVGADESLDAAARRALLDRVGTSDVFLEQLYTFGATDRDPRHRVITVAYYALVDERRFADLVPGADVRAVRVSVPWEGETGGSVDTFGSDGAALPLAFDHADILGMAVKRLRGKLDYTPVGFQMLPPAFTLRQLQGVHETILSRALNKDSFRRRMLASGQLEATGERQQDVGHRPAGLYRFRTRSAL
jgi:8-oxo-dGTP diphosphatase